MVTYTDSLAGVEPRHLEGFFVGWPSQPSPQRHLAVLEGSSHLVLARDEDGRVVGFVSSLSDGELAAYVPLLEVLPEWQGRGIGTELVRRLLERLDGLYMVDVVCDDELVPFYEGFGMTRLRAMGLRNRNALAR
jgi:ribosomal protein S18 acetylase RimI-like enzyme